MRMNYFTTLFTSFALLAVFAFAPFVSAQYGYGYGGGFWYGTEQVIDSIVQNIEPLLRALLGGYDWSGYLLFEKTLLFILISIVIGLILQKLPVFESFKNKKILRLVAALIGILGVRNLNYIWVGTILVQYEVLFIAIAGILPFMIYWFFVKEFDGLVRKVAWVFYAVIYFGLWVTTTLETYSEVYLWGAVGSLIYAFVFDAWVSNWIEMNDLKKGNKARLSDAVANISREIETIQENITQGHYRSQGNARLAQERIVFLENRIRKLQKGF